MSIENTHYGTERIGMMLESCRHIYFIGIGGINMSSLALITQKRGYRVSGSDRASTALTERLEAAGISVFYRHDACQVEDADAVVYTVAISSDNPEYLRAQERGIPCLSRADYLGYLMTGYRRRIGIAGMHGKSSCTSMCAQVMLEAGREPTVLSGAELPLMEGAYHIGGEENFVFEACEYMDSFLDFNPTVAVILNIEMDHVDYFHSMEQIRSSYARYAARTGGEGIAILNGDDPQVLLAMKEYCGQVVTFGIDNPEAEFRACHLRAAKGRYTFELYRDGHFLCTVALSVTGRHHVYNALACAAACTLAGLTPTEISEGLSHFTGATRRMEWKGSLNGADLYDDYGHHPTEIRATLEGARELPEEGGCLFCVYQPHTYSRTKALFSDFASALQVADRVILTDIYAARETDTQGVSSALLAGAIGSKACYCSDFGAVEEELVARVGEKDVVVVMGAGDVYKIFDCLGERLVRKKKERTKS
ncbi:MAG: UDP-N-acetylmuramate--L-alanine ligase [Clostridia bacterium]|nr:UDP-N-acetylmuramate--L-alanine ligase [Clostridia bacterium]